MNGKANRTIKISIKTNEKAQTNTCYQNINTDRTSEGAFIPVAVDNTMWELSWPPSALRHTLLLPRMAPTQTGLCPLPAASSSFPHPEPVFSAVVWKGIRRSYVLGPVDALRSTKIHLGFIDLQQYEL